MLPLVIATVGHAAWDNILRWMIKQDPDASILHMHWLRILFVCLFLSVVSFRKTPTKHTFYWWFKFSMCGWVIPTLAYTICVMLSGYRIAISLQPLIPLFVALRVSKMEGRRLLALNFALLGTLTIWLIAPWSHREIFLWKIWGSLFAGGLQIMSIVTWFLMLEKENVLANITRGVQMSVLIMFISTIVWTPQHLNAAYMSRWDNWLGLIVAAALSSACKLWVIAQCSNQMSADSIAIFECLHPIATLCTDIVYQNEIFEFDDTLAIILLSIGWILYPKTNI
tara:strand:+ start:3463 stop:4308 length:846 start_codon:yes stop_codon:yes gene_type:complete